MVLFTLSIIFLICNTIEVVVNKYQAQGGFVQYDAGEWSKEEILELQSNSLYDININKSIDDIFKLNSSSGKNFTFGGFTYKEDTSNQSTIDSGTIITNKNRSVSGTTSYEGWQILESEQKDGKTYVTKLVHVGIPEYFLYYCTVSDDAYRAEYLLSNGKRRENYTTLSSGKTINTRSWDNYRDKELDSKGYIKDVHIMTYKEAYTITNDTSIADSIRKVKNANYWLATACDTQDTNAIKYNYRALWFVHSNGGIYSNGFGKPSFCYGIRPVVEMEEGVYIEKRKWNRRR